MSARQEFQHYLVSHPSDFFRIPGYSPLVDPSRDTFKDVLAHHNLTMLAKCSLKPCRQNYRDGFLVIWESGAISNIGHCCAERFVGKEIWDKKVNAYRLEIALPHLRAEIVTRKMAVTHTRRQLQEIRDTIIHFSKMKMRFEKVFPHLFFVLCKASTGDSFRVERQIEKSIEIVTKDGEPTGRWRTAYESQVIGTVEGIYCLRERVLGLLSTEALAALDDVERVPPGSSSFERLSLLKQRFDQIQATIPRLRRWLSAAQRFFSPETETLIRGIPGDRNLEAETREFRFSVLEGNATLEQPSFATRPLNAKERRIRIYRGD